MLNAKLVIVGGGDAKVSEIQLQLPTTIGRSREAKVKLPHPLVSRTHCEVFERDGQLFVRDLGSLNGTYVDSQKIETEQALQPNHLLTLGTVTFRAIYETAGASAEALSERLADSSPSSERPTDRASIPAEAKPAYRPAPQSEVETESDRAAHDTDSNLPALNPARRLETAEPPANLAVEDSSIFSTDSLPSNNGSAAHVAHIDMAVIPAEPEPLGVVGEIPHGDGTVTQPVPASATSIPNTESGQGNADRGQSVKRRPR